MGDTAAGDLTAAEFDQFGPNFMSNIRSRSTTVNTDFPSNTMYTSAFDSSLVTHKPPVFNLMNQNPSFFLPTDFGPSQSKRPNLGGTLNENPDSKWSFPDLRQQELLPGLGRHQFPPQPPPHNPFQPDPNPKTGHDIHRRHHQQAAITDQLYSVAELVQTGNLVLAQEILARLNHFLSPTGKPFNRSAFYCKEALQLLLQTADNSNLTPPFDTPSSPFNLVFKIGAYKSFSEISPLVEFASFTCNQALLEAFEGFSVIHIIDFDIGLGGQWAPLMQELALRGSASPSLKITTIIASRSDSDHIGLCLVRENLTQFANEINLEFEFGVMGIDTLNSCLNSGLFIVPGNEVVSVNLPAGCITDFDLPPPLFLQLIKQMSPRIVVSVDVGCQRMDLPFADHIIHTLHSYSSLLESLDVVNVNTDALQMIERYLIQPGIEKIVTGRFRGPGKLQHWRNLFLSAGFSPVGFSNFAESQAECVVKKMPVRGFQVEKRQSSIVLCWQRKELASASVWRC